MDLLDHVEHKQKDVKENEEKKKKGEYVGQENALLVDPAVLDERVFGGVRVSVRLSLCAKKTAKRPIRN